MCPNMVLFSFSFSIPPSLLFDSFPTLCTVNTFFLLFVLLGSSRTTLLNRGPLRSLIPWMFSVWISNIFYFWVNAMSLSVFNSSWSHLLPFHLVFCPCFKAMSTLTRPQHRPSMGAEKSVFCSFFILPKKTPNRTTLSFTTPKDLTK